MSHCATLQDHRFGMVAKSIWSAELLDASGQELGSIRDVVFEHDSGDILYLVLEYEHRRRVLVPLDRLSLREGSFRSQLMLEDLDRLPAFEEKILADDRQWRAYQELLASIVESWKPAYGMAVRRRSNVTAINRNYKDKLTAEYLTPEWDAFAARVRSELRAIRRECKKCKESGARAA